METIAEHNQECQSGQEITMQLICLEGEEIVAKNISSMDKSHLISVIGGYVTSGVMSQLKDLQKVFENEVIKNRMSSLSVGEIIFLVKIFSQAECASAEFYAIMDKYIGLHLSEGVHIDPAYIYCLLKSFYDSGHARPKLFIKLQKVVLGSMPSINANEICAIVRLYFEMDV